MKDRLYIDGQLVDTPANGLGITLNYKGNILDGLKAISTNYTNTIRLPRTQRNFAIFGVMQEVGNTDTFPYYYHTAVYESDGVPLIRKGSAVLMGISETGIEVVIKWGAGEAWELLASDVTLADLTDTVTATVAMHANPTTWANYPSTKMPNVWHDSVGGVHGRNAWGVQLFPTLNSVKVSKILQLIENDFGVMFTFDDDISDYLVLASEFVPEGNTGTLRFVPQASATEFARFPMTKLSNTFGSTEVLKSGGTQAVKFVDGFTEGSDTGFTAAVDCTVEVSALIVLTYVDQYGGKIMAVIDDSDEPAATINASQTVGQDYTELLFNGLVELKKGTKYYISVSGFRPLIDDSVSYIDIKCTDEIEQAVGVKYNVVKSLPRVKIVDFIAMLAALTGTFPVVDDSDGGNEIHFYSYGGLKTDTPVDWSSKLQGYGVGFKADGWEQANIIRWAEDGYPVGSIIVADNTLEASRELLKSQFVTSKGNAYTYWDIDDETLIDTDGSDLDCRVFKFKKPKAMMHTVEPRTAINLELSYMAEIDLSTVIPAYNVELQSYMTRPKIVEVSVALNPAEIETVELGRSYYFRQFGQRFAMMSLQYSRGIAKCRMLLIPL